MIFGESLPTVEGVAPSYSLYCNYCGRELIGETKEDSVLQALKHGWKIKLRCFAAETEFLGLADLIRALDSNDCFCSRCFKRQFET
jgi:hypothetical protein